MPIRRPSAPRASFRWKARPVVYASVALLVAATTLLAHLVQPLIGTGPIDLIYLLPVIVAANRYGLRPGLAAGVLAALAFNFFFLPPIYTFTITDPQSVLTVLILIGIAAFTSRLDRRHPVARGDRRAQRAGECRARRLRPGADARVGCAEHGGRGL